MAATSSAITVVPATLEGFSSPVPVLVAITDSEGSAVTAYTAYNGSTEHDDPARVEASTTFWFVGEIGSGPYTVTCTTDAGQVFTYRRRTGPVWEPALVNVDKPLLPDTAAIADDPDFASHYAPLANPTFTGSVVVPAANAANEAAQVTAYDATTGRLAIGGHEVGDTGWRDISAESWFESTVWVKHSVSAEAACRIRRTGNVVEFVAFLQPVTSIASSGSTILNAIPDGWRRKYGSYMPYTADGWFGSAGGSAVVVYPSTGTNYLQVTKKTLANIGTDALAISCTWTTIDAWPAALPGTAV